MMLIVTMMTKTTIEMAALVVLATFPHAKGEDYEVPFTVQLGTSMSDLGEEGRQ